MEIFWTIFAATLAGAFVIVLLGLGALVFVLAKAVQNNDFLDTDASSHRSSSASPAVSPNQAEIDSAREFAERAGADLDLTFLHPRAELRSDPGENSPRTRLGASGAASGPSPRRPCQLCAWLRQKLTRRGFEGGLGGS